MRKITFVLLILVLALLMATAATAEMPAGGWETVEYQAVMLPDEEAQAAFDKATAEIDGMIVVSAEIPSVDISERPVFYRGRGRLTGSYIRVGVADERM